MDKKILTALVSLSMLVTFIIYTASAESCPYDSDYKYALKKTLIDYLTSPKNSKLPLSDVKQMLNFYLSRGSMTDSDCPPEINAIVSKADNQIPDATMEVTGTTETDECNVCPDGSLCGEKNAKDQTCTCKDADSDGNSEYCFLKPVNPPKPTCQVCPDGTLCGEKNAKEQTCTCKDANGDGKMEYCFLKPLEPAATTTTTTTPDSKPCNQVARGSEERCQKEGICPAGQRC
jgi:hypothetical protein